MKPELIKPYLVEYIKKEYKRGLTTENCVGLHGTSLESLKFLLTNGVFPGATRGYRDDINLGDFFYTPIQDKLGSGIEDMENAKYLATIYAKKNARKHFIYRELNMDLRNEIDEQLFDWLLEDNSSIKDDTIFSNILRRRGLKPNQVRRILNKSENLRGVIVGIKTNVVDTYIIKSKDNNLRRLDDPRIITNGKGLPHDMIIGIAPCGDIEQTFLESL